MFLFVIFNSITSDTLEYTLKNLKCLFYFSTILCFIFSIKYFQQFPCFLFYNEYTLLLALCKENKKRTKKSQQIIKAIPKDKHLFFCVELVVFIQNNFVIFTVVKFASQPTHCGYKIPQMRLVGGQSPLQTPDL